MNALDEYTNTFFSNAFAEYFSYDKMGNILSLDRYDKEGELMDELAYSYSGHQLQKVEDKAGMAFAYDQQEYSGSGAFARTYDAVGALTSDSSRGVVRIVNNLLSLPDTIYFLDGNRIVNKYDATGRKLESQWHVKRSISTFPLSSYLPETDKTTLFDTIIKVYDGNVEYSDGNVRITNPYGYTILSAKDISTFYNVLNYRGDVAGVYKLVGNKLQCVQKLGYYPSGVLWATSKNQGVQPYKYGEKELLEISGLDMYDNLARYYEPAIGRANSIDPLCESYYSISPYAWCGNNFVNIIDPNGLAWRAIYGVDEDGNETIIGYEWVDEEESYDDDGKLLEGLYEAVVWFQGSEDEKLGEGDNLFGEGAVLAIAIVYGPNGSDDITNYNGYTMSSDPSHFGVIDEGDYTVNHLSPDETLGPYGSDLIIEKRWKHIPAKNGVNPAYPDRKPGYLVNVFIHRSNKDGRAGTFMEKGKLRGISEGCLLIAPNDWDRFNSKMKSAKSFHLKLTR